MPDWDDTDYAAVADSYASVRRPDPRLAAQIHTALDGAATVINVGAGTGAYEPTDRPVIAVEPSVEMRARRSSHLVPALDGRAEHLPFDDGAFAAGLAIFTVHHWPDLDAGLAELARVCRDRVVIVTADPAALDQLWIADYSPEFHAVERRRYPALERVAAGLGAELEVRPLVIPCDCSDGFADAYYARPEAMLDPRVRAAQSAWSFVAAVDEQRFVDRLAADLASGSWDRAHGHLREAPEMEISAKLLIADWTGNAR